MDKCERFSLEEVDGLYMTIENEGTKVIVRAMEQLQECMRCIKHIKKECNNDIITVLLLHLEKNDEHPET